MAGAKCDYPKCDCPISFPEGYQPSFATECLRRVFSDDDIDPPLRRIEQDEFEVVS